MNRFVVEDDVVNVPEWVVDLESFRRWCDDDDLPEKARISYLRGSVWVDLSMEQLYSHNRVKSQFTIVVGGMIESRGLGIYFSDGAYISNVEANISNQPDGMFVSFEALDEGRVKDIEGRAEGYVELEGSPDMVLEVVSRSSVGKDTDVLREAYFQAGIREYWLVDARQPPLKFDILRPGKAGFVAVRKRGGWTRSDMFAASFRLTERRDRSDRPAFTLEVQAADLS
jgi:Uma2 family endonuclease